MFAHFLKILILMGVFLLQSVYADIKIIDGDTIIFNEKKIRLLGIDAPETNQYCFDKNKIKYIPHKLDIKSPLQQTVRNLGI